jgi:AcrR family transcriptional regulator
MGKKASRPSRATQVVAAAKSSKPAKPLARSKPRPREAEPEKPVVAADGKRTALVRAAYELIAENGLEELRTRDIAARVGINIATLHYYFDTKETLVAAVVDHMMDLFRGVRAPLAKNASALTELEHLFATRTYRSRVEPKLDLVVQEMLSRGRRDEKVRARLEAMLLGWNGYVESIIARGVREGDFARAVEPKTAAGVITSFMMGANLQQGVRPSSFSFEVTSASLIAWLRPR